MKIAAAKFLTEMAMFPPVEYPAGRWLTFLGTSGAGKTFLANIIWWQAHGSSYVEPGTAADLYRHTHFEHWPKFVRDCKSGRFNISLAVDSLVKPAFVVIDEIAASNDPSGFVADLLCQVASGRVNKPTVFTGNVTLDTIERMDVRIASRMVRDSNEVIEVSTIDYALRAK